MKKKVSEHPSRNYHTPRLIKIHNPQKRKRLDARDKFRAKARGRRKSRGLFFLRNYDYNGKLREKEEKRKHLLKTPLLFLRALLFLDEKKKRFWWLTLSGL